MIIDILECNVCKTMIKYNIKNIQDVLRINKNILGNIYVCENCIDKYLEETKE
jgi:hypothetical protein